jgi:HlyD family secretion protein
MIKKILLSLSVVVVVGLVLFFAIDGSAKKDGELKTVKVEKGAIIDKALAVGKIEPKNEIAVKSKISGIVKKIYVEIGQEVKIGDPLFDIAPDPTPIEYAEAKRQVELQKVNFANAEREYERSKQMRDKQLISYQEYDKAKTTYDDAQLRLKLAEEKLSLIESGRTQIADLHVDNTIRSPINGQVLERLVEQGDPVVPLTSYQEGTALMTLAHMEKLIFKGNVDEIDVGKLRPGMPAEIEIGAIPNQKLKGTLVRISPKAHKEEGAILFDVEIELNELGDKPLRAGYSANADIIIKSKENIVLVPERLVKTEDSISTVEVMDSLGTIDTVTIATGLSDGINIEVVTGVDSGQMLVERPPKEITAD